MKLHSIPIGGMDPHHHASEKCWCEPEVLVCGDGFAVLHRTTMEKREVVYVIEADEPIMKQLEKCCGKCSCK